MAEKTSSQWTGLNDRDRQAVAEFLRQPTLYSETLARRTLEQCGAQGFNVQDVQEIIQTHMNVLRDALREGHDL